MPVIRGQPQVSAITAEQRQEVAQQLARELAGERTLNGPVIFEIPIGQQPLIDVLVAMDAWEPFGSTDRSDMILDAYKPFAVQIAQPLGVTYHEAIEQQVLPYGVVPTARRGEIDDEDVKAAMLAEGGFAVESGKVDLRFPTMALAEQAHKRLSDSLPKGYWSIVQSAG